MYDVVSFGSVTEDVFVSSKTFHLIKDHRERDICFPFGRKIELKDVRFDLGGGALNSATGFSRMGLKAGICANMGKDLIAEKAMQRMEKEGISERLLMECKEESSGFSVILRKSNADRTVLVYRGANNLLEARKVNWKELKKTKWMYVSSFASKGELGGLLEKLFRFAKKNGIKIMFNPGSQQRKHGFKKMKPLLRKTAVLLLNNYEITSFTGKSDAEDAIEKAHEAGAELVAVTEGPKKELVSDGSVILEKKPYNVKIEDSTGAGDAFGSGFLSGLIKTGSLEKALKFGSANACSVIQHVGTNKGLLKWKEAERFIKRKENKNTKTKIRKLK